MARELHKRGIQISRPRVARLMKVAGIRSIVHRKFRIRTTDSNHNYPIAKNLLDRKFDPGAVAKAWVSDITYIKTTQGCGAARAVISNRYCGLGRPQGSRVVVERNDENVRYRDASLENGYQKQADNDSVDLPFGQRSTIRLP